MASLSKVDKKIGMDRWDIIKFQLLVHCYLRRIHISEHDLLCLTLLGMTGEQTLEDFCSIARSNEIFSSNQSARNALAKAEKKGLIIKQGKNRKKISLSPNLNIVTSGNIVINMKVVYLESQPAPVYESQES